MANSSRYLGVNFNNLRKALYIMFFGLDPIKTQEGQVISYRSDSFDSPKYKYIIPMQGNFDNPLQLIEKDTFIMYWIERDESLTQDDYIIDENNQGWNRQKCVASILVRFIGKEAEDWVKTFRHLTKRKGIPEIFEGVCNARKLEYTSPVIPRKINYFGMNSQIAFDVRFKLYYDEVISTGWKPLTGINFTIEHNLIVKK